MLLNNDSLFDSFTFLPREELDTNIIVSRQFRDVIAGNARFLPLRIVASVMLRVAMLVGGMAREVQEGLLGLSVGEHPAKAVEGEVESRTVDHLTIVSGQTHDERGDERRTFHVDGIKSVAELFTLFGLYARNSYVGFYLALNFPGEPCEQEWNEFFASLRTMKVDRLVAESDLVPPPELFLKFASASIRCLTVFSTELSAAHFTNDFLKNAGRNGVTSIRIRIGPIDGDYYAVEEDAVLDYCFPKDGPPIAGRTVRLLQLRLGPTFLQKVVEAYKARGIGKESAFYRSPIVLSEQEGNGDKNSSEDDETTIYEDKAVVVSISEGGQNNANMLFIRARREY